MTLNCQDSAQQRCTLFNGNKNTYIGFTDSSTNLKGISWQDQITYPQYDVWWAVQSMNPFLPPSVPNGLIFHNRDRNCYLDINYSSTVGIYSYQIACLTEDQGRSWYWSINKMIILIFKSAGRQGWGMMRLLNILFHLPVRMNSLTIIFSSLRAHMTSRSNIYLVPSHEHGFTKKQRYSCSEGHPEHMLP
jgi:hypothetical protein